MQSNLRHPLQTRLADMSANESNLVLANARALQRSAGGGAAAPLLRGKNLALMSESPDDAEALRFVRAATELGAHVAYVRPSLSSLGNAVEVRHTARMLGRLYDAIACQGMDATAVQGLRNDAGVPVYEDLAADRHPSAALADGLGDDGTPDERRRYVLQAVLITTLA